MMLINMLALRGILMISTSFILKTDGAVASPFGNTLNWDDANTMFSSNKVCLNVA